MTFKDRIKERIKGYLAYQVADLSRTVPVQRWSPKDRRFYLNSEAGLLIYKPKNEQDQIRFRNAWINEFDKILTLKGKARTVALFHFYVEIRSKERISYRANIHTRLKGRAVCTLSRFI